MSLCTGRHYWGFRELSKTEIENNCRSAIICLKCNITVLTSNEANFSPETEAWIKEVIERINKSE